METTKEKQYYTVDEVEKGIDGLMPISRTTLRNLRSKRKIKFSKRGRDTIYMRKWVEDYLLSNVVECGSNVKS